MMRAIYAYGQVMKPLFVLLGKQIRYWNSRRSERDAETGYDILPNPSFLNMRSVAGVNTDICFA